jgi:hypothetical protein
VNPVDQLTAALADRYQVALLRPVGGEAKALIVHNWRRELQERLARGAAK